MELNEELFEKVSKLIYPLLKEALDKISIEKQEEINKEIIQKHFDERKRVIELYTTVCFTFKKIKEINHRENIFRNNELPHFLNYEYLLLTEGIFTRQINLICFFLVKNGREFEYYEREKRKLRTTIKQIQKAYLADKLNFLEDCDFGLFWKYYDNQLRNAIAHVDYKIDDDGNIIFKDKKLSLEEYQQKIFDLMDLSCCITESLRRYYVKYVQMRPPS